MVFICLFSLHCVASLILLLLCTLQATDTAGQFKKHSILFS